jgi:hypothetical protein
LRPFSIPPSTTFYIISGLAIYNCKKINRLDELSELKNLEYIYFDNIGNIESIECLKSLSKLEWVNFIGDINILDGNMSILQDLPNLIDVAFVNRKHYNIQKKDIQLQNVELVRPYPLSRL